MCGKQQKWEILLKEGRGERKKHFSLRRIERASRRKNEEVLEIENGNSGFFLTESETFYIIDWKKIFDVGHILM